MKRLLTIFGIILNLSLPSLSRACSLVSCSPKNSDEMRSDFVVKITLQGRPLANVNTWVTRFPGDESKLFSGVTGNDGTVRIHDLQPGEYWLVSELLGISAGGICFHVEFSPVEKGQEQSHSIRVGRGHTVNSSDCRKKLIDPAPGEGAVFLQNIIHHVVAPIKDAELKLQDPLTGAVYTAVSNDDGSFSFGQIANGTYVLHIEGGATPVGHELRPTDFLIRVVDTATRGTLLLERSGGSTCGGPYITLERPYKTL